MVRMGVEMNAKSTIGRQVMWFDWIKINSVPKFSGMRKSFQGKFKQLNLFSMPFSWTKSLDKNIFKMAVYLSAEEFLQG